jgi:hypothetical protein
LTTNRVRLACWNRAVVVVAITLVTTAALAGCGVARTVTKIADTGRANKATIDQFTSKLKSGQPGQFEVTYATTGSAPSKITYAVQPPDQLAFIDSGIGSGTSVSKASFIVNSTGEYGCTQASRGVRWTCDKLPKAGAAAQRKLLGIYTPAHWVTFLQDFSLAAGFAGDKISSSSITVHGFAMQCVDFVASGVAGTSKICTTAQHLLGYVQVASESTSFAITSYTAAPRAALFRLPAGARITPVKGGTG